MIYSFSVTIDGVDVTGTQSSDADILYGAGCDDALLGSDGEVQWAIFDREAPSFAAAVASAITAIETSIPGARVRNVNRLDPAEAESLPRPA